MKTLLLVIGLSLTTPDHSPAYPSPQQSLTERREVLKSVVAITTRPVADLASVPATQEIEHDSEVDRSEVVTVVVMMQGCQPDAQGACRASADVVAFKPDGSIHSEVKAIDLATGRGTTTLKLTPSDVTGVYRVVATVRDLNARRFGKTERLFGVK
ncbi:MAG: hypothetical protein ABW292_20030 [Vicinamibacterales bacterium]|jgi:hypothetical protein